jgi:membrane protease YdiL (CAAX protease family)
MLTPADHLLVLCIVVGLPLRALFGIRALRAAPAASLPELRRRLWWRAIATQWLLTVVVLWHWAMCFRSFATLALLLKPTTGLVGVLVGLTTIITLVARQRGALSSDETLRTRVRDRLAPVEQLMPHAAREWPLFVALACTAGLCEELLFRGYLLWYAAHFMPLMFAAVAQAVVFGLCHAYQGRRGVLLTTLAGAFFTGVLLVSGSIWPAMLIHALMDLHAGDLARRVFPPELEPSYEPAPGGGG